MTERPILFSGEMVKAILDGRKTQTRRVVKPQPRLERDLLEPENANAYLFAVKTDVGTTRMLGRQNYTKEFSPFQVGLKLWVRETWAEKAWNDDECRRAGCPDARQGEEIYLGENLRAIYKASYNTACGDCGPWKPSIFMPRWASRLTLEIVSVRVERLQEISAKDVLAEGAVLRPHEVEMLGKCPISAFDEKCYVDLRSLWAAGWNSINGKKYPWSSNPFVFVIGFKRV